VIERDGPSFVALDKSAKRVEREREREREFSLEIYVVHRKSYSV